MRSAPQYRISTAAARLLRMSAVAALLLLPLGSAGTAFAQTVTVTKLADLSFGNMYQSSVRTVDFDDAAAAKFKVEVNQNNKTVRLQFSLPASITNGGNSLPVTFLPTGAGYRVQTNSPAGATVFDPNGTVTVTLGGGPNRTMYVWIGGKATTSGATVPGAYTGSVTLTATVL